MIQNPILPGFNPDPSICRVGDDYYIATSTFEWYPGVQIHHSTNLVDWQLVARPLCRASQLDMRGNPDSCGVWAPCLSYADGLFWLVYTDVKRYDGNFKDAHNYLVTASSITGDWSERTHINSSGFDPTLFHDDDGRKWFLNLVWNHRTSGLERSPLHSAFGGIVLQEYSPEAAALTGSPELIFVGSEKGLTEGPHVFKREGYYYLVTAEGGTGFEHAVTHARSRQLNGPYELHPDTHIMTAHYQDNGQLQRTGHGQTVTTPAGQWYHTHLCSRPLPGMRRSPLGRETGIQQCEWGDDGWLRLSHGTQQAAMRVPAPGAQDEQTQHVISNQTDVISERYAFDSPELPLDFQWLRSPEPGRLFSLTDRPGYLRLYGRESVGSFFEQSLVARRLQHHHARFSTKLQFSPTSFQQSAGLVAYYNRHKFHYLQLTHDEQHGCVLSVMSCDGDWPEAQLHYPVPAAEGVCISEGAEVELQCHINGPALQFFWRKADRWVTIGPALDASVLSDEGGRGEHASFTGCFVGMLAFDISGGALPADFSYFEYTTGRTTSAP